MLAITGEVRKVLDEPYTDKRSSELIPQVIIVIEPPRGRDNYEVYLSRSQIKPEALAQWRQLRGSTVSVPVALYLNHEHQFHKFNAKGSPEPVTVKGE